MVVPERLDVTDGTRGKESVGRDVMLSPCKGKGSVGRDVILQTM